jgi:acyl carrier protein
VTLASDETAATLGRLFAERVGAPAPAPSDDLLDGGRLDSLALVELLLAIEQEFAIEIPAELLEADRIRTLERLAELVATCRGD